MCHPLSKGLRMERSVGGIHSLCSHDTGRRFSLFGDTTRFSHLWQIAGVPRGAMISLRQLTFCNVTDRKSV